MGGNYTNSKYTGTPSIPVAVGDRHYAQDLFRDLRYHQEQNGLVFERLFGTGKVIIEGLVVTQGVGHTINITAGKALNLFNIEIPHRTNAWALPPDTETIDIKTLTVIESNISNLAITSAVTDGVTINYVKLKYNEIDGNTRTRAKKSGTYSYEVKPFYTITVDNVAPTTYEVVLETFTSNGVTITFLGNESDRMNNSLDGTTDFGLGTLDPQRLLHVLESSATAYIRLETEQVNGKAAFELLNDVQKWELAIDTDDNFKIIDSTNSKTIIRSVPNGIVDSLVINTSELVINEAGANLDFRVEGNTDANLLLCDAGNDVVYVGASTGASTVAKLFVKDSGSKKILSESTQPGLILKESDVTDKNAWIDVEGGIFRILSVNDSFSVFSDFFRIDFGNNQTVVNQSTSSTSKDTGALLVASGGLGVEENVNAGGIISADGGFKAFLRDETGTESTTAIKEKVIRIGDWNMDTTINVSVAHGLSSTYLKIRSIDVIIRNDTNAFLYSLFNTETISGTGVNQGWLSGITSTSVSLYRLTGGFFDSTSFDSTSFNRGWIIIRYEA